MNFPDFPFSPLVQISDFHIGNRRLFMKREDLIHEEFGGNKWRKLKYNIQEFLEGDYSHLISFGGPFSNHIAALASVGRYFRIPVVGIIRGNYVDLNNPTLVKAASDGMTIHHVSKEAYRMKEKSQEVKNILDQYPKPFLLPEGGSNQYAFKGVQEIQNELTQQGLNPDVIFVAAGTGMTAAGMIESSLPHQNVVVINIMKNTGMQNRIESFLSVRKDNWKVVHDYHFGGYANVNAQLVEFINDFFSQTGIALDPVYNGKTMFALIDMIKKGNFADDATILHIHTGGYQGIKAYNYCCKDRALRLIVH